jgi:hypothetical protein
VLSLWRASEQALAKERGRLAEERRRTEQERQLRKRAQWFARVAGGLLFLCVGTLLAMGWFYWFAQTAQTDALASRNRAIAAVEEARQGETRALTAEAVALSEKDRALAAEQLA